MKIVVSAPTFKRPEMLRKLVNSLLISEIDPATIDSVTILIVDNDVELSAKNVIDELIAGNRTSFNIVYHSYPRRGLANVRNEILRVALDSNPDYILGIDDDEFVSPVWISKMVSSIILNKCEIVMGPVIPVFEENIPSSISYWFKSPNHPDNKQLNYFWTSSFIVSARFIKENDLRFESRFNSSGGEDSYFGFNALRLGARIYWAHEAIAYETNPANRTCLKWLMKRSFNGAANYTLMLRLQKKYFRFVKKAFVSLLYLLAGIGSLVIVPLPFKTRYFGLLKISESLGGFAGVFGLQLREYAKR